MTGVPRFLDVSVPLTAATPTYPGNPDFEMQPIERIAEGASSNVSRLVMGTHAGPRVGYSCVWQDPTERRLASC